MVYYFPFCYHFVITSAKSECPFHLFLYKIFPFYQTIFKDLQHMHYPFYANVPFLYPLKTSETKGFLTFSGGIEIGHWREKG